MSALPRSVAALALLAGCLGSPQPEPENVAAEWPFDLDQVRASVDGDRIRFEGGPGAVAAVEVLGVSLDAPAALVAAPVAAGGSFELAVPGGPGDRFRLHAVTAIGIEPVDVVLDGARVELLDDCAVGLSVTEYRDFGRRAVGDSRTSELVLFNRCGERLSFRGTRALAGTGAFAIELGDLADLAAGQGATVTARFAPLEVGEVVDYLAIDVEGHPAYVLTVRGRGE
jgi:hypothetical protein